MVEQKNNQIKNTEQILDDFINKPPSKDFSLLKSIKKIFHFLSYSLSYFFIVIISSLGLATSVVEIYYIILY